MTNQTNEITLPMDAAEWPRLFHESNFDCVLDPMVVRAADFFIGGPDYCRAMGQGATADHWPVIESNFDGVLAFFHILMTRDRIPLIDYWHTFDSKLHSWLGDSVVLKVHGGPVYRGIEQKALAKLSTVVDTLPQGASLDLDNCWRSAISGNLTSAMWRFAERPSRLPGLFSGGSYSANMPKWVGRTTCCNASACE
jgi:hypothetical protein